MNRRMFALLSKQGTACDEVALCEICATPENKRRAERFGYSGDPPVPDSWTDCTGNDALACVNCGFVVGQED